VVLALALVADDDSSVGETILLKVGLGGQTSRGVVVKDQDTATSHPVCPYCSMSRSQFRSQTN